MEHIYRTKGTCSREISLRVGRRQGAECALCGWLRRQPEGREQAGGRHERGADRGAAAGATPAGRGAPPAPTSWRWRYSRPMNRSRRRSDKYASRRKATFAPLLRLSYQTAGGGIFGVYLRQLLLAVDIGLVDTVYPAAAGVAAAIAAVTGAPQALRARRTIPPRWARVVSLMSRGLHEKTLLLVFIERPDGEGFLPPRRVCQPAMSSIFSMNMP